MTTPDGLLATAWDVAVPHLRNIIEATGVMLGAWLLVERLLGWLPKKWGKAIKPLLAFGLGLAGLLLLDEMVRGVHEAAHHASLADYIVSHSRAIFYGLVAGGLPPLLHPWLKSKVPGWVSGAKN